MEQKNDSESIAVQPVSSSLFVGARLYRKGYNRVSEVLTIDRITKTQAISGHRKFKIDLSNYGTADLIGNMERWSSMSYYLETPELQKELWVQQSVDLLSKFDYSKLSVDVLQSVLSLVNGG